MFIDVLNVELTAHFHYQQLCLLNELMRQLDPVMFYRANRQFIISKAAVTDITNWFGNRVVVNLSVPTPERIVVSRTNVQEFKKWLTE